MSDLLCACPPNGHAIACPIHGLAKAEWAEQKAALKGERKARHRAIRQQSAKQAYREGVLAGVRAERILALTFRGPVPGLRCEACGEPCSEAEVELHHVEHRSQGARAKPGDLGVDDPRNLILLCRSCHEREHPGPWTT